MMSSLHFLRPGWLWLIVPLLLLWLLLWRNKPSTSSWQAICDPHLLDQLMHSEHNMKKRWWMWPLLLAWLLATLAMAGPTMQKQPTPTYRQLQSRVILLDVSPNMLAADLKPDRLTRAKFKAIDLLKQLKEGQVGFTVFAGQAHVVSPLTQDSQTIMSLVPAISTTIMPVQGGDMAAGIRSSVALLQNAKQKHGEVILMTSSAPNADAINAATALAKAGYSLMVWGIGTVQGAPIPSQAGFAQNASGQLLLAKLPETALRQLAVIGHGHYVAFSNTNADIQQVLSYRPSTTRSIKQKNQLSDRWLDQGYLLLLPLLLLGLLAFRRGYWQ